MPLHRPGESPDRSHEHDPDTDPTPHAPPRRRLPLSELVRPYRSLETALLVSTACLLAAVAWPIAREGLGAAGSESAPPATADPTPDPAPPATVSSSTEGPTIQIALLLDTSSSMSGLLDQARSHLWRVVNALDSATYHGATPRLEIAIYEYGNDGLSADVGYIRQVTAFSAELDRVSLALFELTTYGGSEWAPTAIDRAVSDLQWRDGDDVLRVLYIAGNESFLQGPTPVAAAIARARERSVVVNTVNCIGHGHPDEGWEQAATMGGGRFIRIDHNEEARYVAAPQDAEIERLGRLINETYIHYGAQGRWGIDNLRAQDRNALGSGASSTVQRSLSKGSALYKNPSWELIDALDEGTIDLDAVDASSLPAELQDKSPEELEQHVQATRARRAELQQRLAELQAGRQVYVDAIAAQDAEDGAQRLDTAIVDSIVDLAQASGFTVQ